MSTRRAFLGTLGKALGAGGVLLPWAGKGALALPADLGKAASLPVMPTPLPISAEMLQLREARRELHNIYLWPNEFRDHEGRNTAWRDVMRNKHEPTAQLILGRKNPTWSDCVEIAEIALHRMYRLGPREKDDITHKLVWAVLSAGGVNEVFVPEIGGFTLDKAPGQLW